MALTLLLLWGLPLAFDAGQESLRDRLSRLDVARTAVAEMQAAHALQVAALRGRGLHGAEPMVNADLAEHERRDAQARRSLALALGGEPADSPLVPTYERLLRSADAWHRYADRLASEARPSRPTVLDLAEQRKLYREVLQDADALERRLTVTATEIRDERQRLGRVERVVAALLATLALATALFVTRLGARVDAERRLARRDPLTGLPNRRELAERFELEQRRAARSGQPLTLAILDLDGFKVVNDRHGHQRGDAVLAAVARGMAAALREVDVIARIGGDEFAILLVEAEDPRGALERLRGAVREAASMHGVALDASVGAIRSGDPGASLDTLLRRADGLMYEVKRGQRGQVRLADPPAMAFVSRSP